MGREVYFAQCGHRVKIGISANVPARLAQLRQGAGGAVSLIASVQGDFEIERALQQKLKPYLIDGEWFRDCPEVRAAIQNSVNSFPPPSPAELRTRTAAKFKVVCKALWPENTAEIMAEIAGVDARTAKRWLSGENEAPGVIVAAIASEITKRD